METIVIGVVALVALLIGLSSARAFGSAATRAGVDALLQSLRNGVPGTLTLAGNLADQFYERVIYPISRSLSKAAKIIIALATGFGVWNLLMQEDGGGVWALVTLVVGVATLALLVLNDLRATGEYSAWNVLGYACLGLLVLGAALFAGGQATHSVGCSVMGAVLIVVAIEIVFATAHFFARLATFGIDVAEGSSNYFVRMVTHIAAKGKNGALEAVQKGVNLADQERFIPAVYAMKARIILSLYPVLMVGVLDPDFKSSRAMFAVSFAGFILYSFLAAAGHDILGRRLRSALLIEKLGYALMAMMLLRTFFPNVWAALVVVYKSLEADLLAGDTSFGILPWYAAVVGGVAALVLLLVLKPGNASRAQALRWILAAPFAILVLYCASSLVLRAVTWGSADTVALNRGKTLSVGKMPAPQAEPHGSMVRLTWSEIPKAVGYTVERRLSTKTDYTELTEFAKGSITSFDDTSAKPNETYAYRVVARYVSGVTEPSHEILVTLPPDLTKSSPSATQTGPNAERKARRHAPVRVASSGDGEPGAERYCSRNPNSPSCAKDPDEDP